LALKKIHQQAFDLIKATIACDVVLAYPDYSEKFEIYADASQSQRLSHNSEKTNTSFL
jgi:hypothetical protein